MRQPVRVFFQRAFRVATVGYQEQSEWTKGPAGFGAFTAEVGKTAVTFTSPDGKCVIEVPREQCIVVYDVEGPA